MIDESLRPLPLIIARTIMPLPLLDPAAAADHAKVKRHTLACYRSTGQGPAFYKFGRWIRYAREDLDAWTSGQSVDHLRLVAVPNITASRTMVPAVLAARLLTITRFGLKGLRGSGAGPNFVQWGRRIYYVASELESWAMAQRLRTSRWRKPHEQ